MKLVNLQIVFATQTLKIFQFLDRNNLGLNPSLRKCFFSLNPSIFEFFHQQNQQSVTTVSHPVPDSKTKVARKNFFAVGLWHTALGPEALANRLFSLFFLWKEIKPENKVNIWLGR